MKHEFKVGDEVKIKESIYPNYPCKVKCVDGMEKYAGKYGKITYVTADSDGDYRFRLDVDGGSWWWDEYLVEKMELTLF